LIFQFKVQLLLYKQLAITEPLNTRLSFKGWTMQWPCMLTITSNQHVPPKNFTRKYFMKCTFILWFKRRITRHAIYICVSIRTIKA